MMLCSVSALGAGLSMKQRYDPLYTDDQGVIVISYQDDLDYCKQAKLEPLKMVPGKNEALEFHKKYLLSIADNLGEIPFVNEKVLLIASSDSIYIIYDALHYFCH